MLAFTSSTELRFYTADADNERPWGRPIPHFKYAMTAIRASRKSRCRPTAFRWTT